MGIPRTILTRATEILMDRDAVRWPLAELAVWANDGVRALVMAKPSVASESIIFSCDAGSRQLLPTAAGGKKVIQLLDIPRNLKSTADDPRVGGRAVLKAEREVIDATWPYWHDADTVTQAPLVRRFCFNKENPREFFVFPGNNGTGIIEIVVALLPAPIVATGDAQFLTNYTSEIDLPEMWEGPLLDYILYRAYSKEDLAAAGSRSMFHYGQFAQAVGLRTQVEAATSPNAPKG